MSTICTNRPGPCVLISKVSGNQTQGLGSWVIPYFEEAKFSATQKLKQPVKEFFTDLKDFITNGPSGIINGLADAVMKGLDLFGIQLFSKGFYAQAWAGEDPTPFTLTLKFFMGMNGLWDASKEVVTPILDILKQTIPYESISGGGIMFPSAPAPLQVFLAFSNGVISGIEKTATAIDPTVLGPSTTFLGGGITTALKAISAITPRSGGIWNVGFGWTSGAQNSAPQIYFTMPNTVVESSSWSFSPMLQQQGTKVYPITGDLTLNFKTQSILTNVDLVDAQAKAI